MAGFYNDVPGRRIPWDRDGSLLAGYSYDATSFGGVFSAAQRQAVNDEATGFSDSPIHSGNFSTGAAYVVIFPRHYDIVGWYLGFVGNMTAKDPLLEWSANTTNGIDGTWAGPLQLSAGSTGLNTDTVVRMRQNIATAGAPLSNAKAMRFRFRDLSAFGDGACSSWHIYGTPVDTTRLAIWHPTLDQEHGAAYFDWGDTPRGTTFDRDFRVKNLDPVRTANGIVVSREALSLVSPSQVTQHMLSADAGASFQTSLSIGALAPGAISSVLRVRNTVDAAAALGLAWLRLVAAAASFT